MPFFPEAPLAPPVAQAPDFAAYRELYRASVPNLRKFAYMNHASVGPLSDWVRAASDSFNEYQQMAETCIQHDWFDGWRLARQRTAELIGAEKDELCLLSSTYTGALRVCNALPLGPGDEVVYCADEFPSLYHALTELRGRGCTMVEARSAKGDGIVRTSDVLDAITAKTRLVAISWVNFFHGYRQDLKRIGEACRERGAWFMVDVIQGLGMLSLDVKDCHVHFVTGQGAKWLCAPLGSGFLYVSRAVPPEITPRTEGWFAMELDHVHYTNRDIHPKANANRFGLGTVPMISAYGLRRACEVFLEAGPQRAEAAALENAAAIISAASSAGLPLFSDHELPCAIVSFDLARREAVRDKLDAANVVYSVREGKLRLSPHWYQTGRELDRVCECLSSK
jgi:cysteine desulfurase / selenocysteine lyase